MNETQMTRSEAAAQELPGQRTLPTWPAASLGLLLVLEIVMPAGFISTLDAALLFLAAIVWSTSGARLPRPMVEIVLPFVAICLAGLLAGIGAETYTYLKDAWYTSNPPLILGVGYVLFKAKPDMPRGLRAFVLGGTVVAVTYIVPFILDPSLLRLEAARSRELVGAGHFAPALAILAIAACRGDCRSTLRMPRWLASACLAICVAACVMSFSRTILVTVIIGLLAVYGFFMKRVWFKIAIVVLAAAALGFLLKMTVDAHSSEAKQTFVGKLVNSIDEMSMQEYFDFKRINESYRGFESSRALHAYADGDPVRWVVGQGFGAELDLKVWVPAVGRYLPVLHNGYMYLLFKGGALAVCLFLGALLRLYQVGARAAAAVISTRRIAGQLLQAVALGLVVTTWVIAGVFNKLDLYSFLLCAGFLCGYLTESA